MRVDLDTSHTDLVQRALASGRAMDVQAYIHGLIEEDAVDAWARGRSDAILKAVDQAGDGRDVPGTLADIHQRLLARLEDGKVA